MQLHLEADELDLLANVVMERISAISAQSGSSDPVTSDKNASPDAQLYNDLLDKLLAHDLRLDCDELQRAADLLAARKCDLERVIAQEQSARLKSELSSRLALLERALERVDEACAMM